MAKRTVAVLGRARRCFAAFIGMAGVPLLFLMVSCDAPGGRESPGARIERFVLTPSVVDLPADWSAAAFTDAIRDAAARWSYPNIPCGVKLEVAASEPAWRAEPDAINLVAFRSRVWCHNERCGADTTFPLRAAAMTTTYPLADAGHPVREADIELNAAAFTFTPGDARRQASQGGGWSVPIEAVLVHEIGHALGLADVCAARRRASGRPDVSGCSAEDRGRVMFASGGEATPNAADVADLCRLYPPPAWHGRRSPVSADTSIDNR